VKKCLSAGEMVMPVTNNFTSKEALFFTFVSCFIFIKIAVR